mmetsp:Transcript_16044/g.34744  ORF Transcript_16044/g.34744 Transcript_16044/m.34744 type:complete len:967 (+) Transcript_16044:83-2983(+)
MSRYVGKLVSVVSSALDVNAATLTGAMDIIVVQHADGSLHSSPFHVRFGKLKLLRSREKLVSVSLNNEPTELQLTLGSAGEAYFLHPSDTPPPADMAPSPITSPLTSPKLTPVKHHVSIKGGDERPPKFPTPRRQHHQRQQRSQRDNDHESRSPLFDASSSDGGYSPADHESALTTPSEMSLADFSDPNALKLTRTPLPPPFIEVEPSAPHHPTTQQTPRVSSPPPATPSGVMEAGTVVKMGKSEMEGETEENEGYASVGLEGRGLSRARSSKRMTRKYSVASELTQAFAADGAAVEMDDAGDLTARSVNAASAKSLGSSGGVLKNAASDLSRGDAAGRAGRVDHEEEEDDDDEHEEGLLAMSVCRHLLREDMEESEVQAIFEEHRVNYSHFATDPIGMLFHNPNVLFRVQDRLVEWKVAAPTIVAMAAFDAPLDIDRVERAVEQRAKEQHAQLELEMASTGVESKTSGFAISSWFGFGRTAAPASSSSSSALVGDNELEALMPLEASNNNNATGNNALVIERRATTDSARAASLDTAPNRHHTAAGSLGTLDAEEMTRGRASSASFAPKESEDLLTDEPFISTEKSAAGRRERNTPERASGASRNKGAVHKLDSAPVLSQQAAAVRKEELVGPALEQAEAEHRVATSMRELEYSQDASGEICASQTGGGDGGGDDDDGAPRYLRKSFVPTSEQLKRLKLKRGTNVITFTVLSNGQHVSSRVFLWHADDAVVISDVDGTITRSDVLGHLLPRVGRDWSQAGIAQLYLELERLGFKLMYLTSRPIGQAGSTRLYIQNVRQGENAELSLPEGPVVMSPDRLVTSFTREVIRRRPDEFKVAALQQIRQLFPPDHNPFFAGFGNRPTDEISYRSVGVAGRRIFTVNPKAELDVLRVNYSACESYTRLREGLEDFFPDIANLEGRHRVENAIGAPDFSDLAFWDVPSPFDSPPDDATIDHLLREALADVCP